MTSRVRRNEDAQVLPLMAMLVVVMCGVIGLAVDLGRVYVTRAQLSRSLDAAALAGVVELPNTSAATTKAVAYMNVNMPNATNVTAVPDAPAQKVTMSATAGVNTLFMKLLGINSVSVHAEAEAGASNSGSSALPLDAMLVLDDTGSMGSGCTTNQRDNPSVDQTSPACPIGLTRNGAQQFLSVLFPASGSPASTKVGYTAFRGCYNSTPWTDANGTPISGNKYNLSGTPIASGGQPNLNPLKEDARAGGLSRGYWWYRGCISRTDHSDLSSSSAAIQAKVNTLRGAGGYPGTNVCLGLAEGYKLLSDPLNAQPGARKVLIILTDGDSSFTDGAENAGSQSNALPSARVLSTPVPNPYPGGVTGTNGVTGTSLDPSTGVSNCRANNSDKLYDGRINRVDSLALQQADLMKAAGVEIYVVGYGVRGGADTGAFCSRALITGGNFAATSSNRASNSDTLDRNVNKCLASSKTSTNDHYFETTALGLPAVFQHIATQISYRLIK